MPVVHAYIEVTEIARGIEFSGSGYDAVSRF
jgi:hypothetical protein